jgi:hypothetical protein
MTGNLCSNSSTSYGQQRCNDEVMRMIAKFEKFGGALRTMVSSYALIDQWERINTFCLNDVP